jgi:hypothetical protein
MSREKRSIWPTKIPQQKPILPIITTWRSIAAVLKVKEAIIHLKVAETGHFQAFCASKRPITASIVSA